MIDGQLYAELARLEQEGRAFVVATVVKTAGSCPQKPGARLALLDDGTLLGTIGGGAIEKQVLDACQVLLRSGEPSRMIETHLTRDLGMCCGGSMTLFLEHHAPGARLWLFGAGHVHRAAAELAQRCGFRTTVVDEREDWLTALRFPRAERLLEDPAVAAKRVALDAQDFACVATHDHALDEQVLKALRGRPLRYLGMIGSERKALRFRERLSAQGFTEAEIARIHTPMGLPIGAQTPEEIAVSIVAQLVALRRQGEPPPSDAER